MNNKELKQKFPMCWSVAFKDARYAQRHQFKLKDDKETILSYIRAKRYDLLEYMEQFYWALKKSDRRCERDIYNTKIAVSFDIYNKDESGEN